MKPRSRVNAVILSCVGLLAVSAFGVLGQFGWVVFGVVLYIGLPLTILLAKDARKEEVDQEDEELIALPSEISLKVKTRRFRFWKWAFLVATAIALIGLILGQGWVAVCVMPVPSMALLLSAASAAKRLTEDEITLLGRIEGWVLYLSMNFVRAIVGLVFLAFILSGAARVVEVLVFPSSFLARHPGISMEMMWGFRLMAVTLVVWVIFQAWNNRGRKHKELPLNEGN